MDADRPVWDVALAMKTGRNSLSNGNSLKKGRDGKRRAPLGSCARSCVLHLVFKIFLVDRELFGHFGSRLSAQNVFQLSV